MINGQCQVKCCDVRLAGKEKRQQVECGKESIIKESIIKESIIYKRKYDKKVIQRLIEKL